jgi:hypothetical protein
MDVRRRTKAVSVVIESEVLVMFVKLGGEDPKEIFLERNKIL